MRVNRLYDALGAEITGIDVSDIDADTLDAVNGALLEHLIVVFRDQNLTPDQHIASGREIRLKKRNIDLGCRSDAS